MKRWLCYLMGFAFGALCATCPRLGSIVFVHYVKMSGNFPKGTLLRTEVHE